MGIAKAASRLVCTKSFTHTYSLQSRAARDFRMTSVASPSTSADVCRTGIEGFDHLVGGGVPRNCFYLLQGDPGSGKTTFALQFLLEGLRSGERAFYITLSETRGELERVALSHAWSLERIPLLELSAIDSLLRPESQTTVFHPSEVELSKITGLVLAEVRKRKPSRVVFDSLSEFRLVAETPLRYRRQLLSLKQELTLLGCTVLLLDDKMDSTRMGPDPHVLSITHGVIEMEQLSPDYGKSRRRLRIVKVRGVRFHEGYHDYIIETGGLRSFPDSRRPPVAAPFAASLYRAEWKSWMPSLAVDSTLGARRSFRGRPVPASRRLQSSTRHTSPLRACEATSFASMRRSGSSSIEPKSSGWRSPNTCARERLRCSR